MRFGIPISEKQSISFGAGIDYTKVTIDYHKEDETTTLSHHFSTGSSKDEFCNSQDSCANVAAVNCGLEIRYKRTARSI